MIDYLNEEPSGSPFDLRECRAIVAGDSAATSICEEKDILTTFPD
jgi:hypothetical protein